MRLSYNRRWLVGRPLLVLFALSLLGEPAMAAETKMLPGHVPAAVARLAAEGWLPASNRLDLAIGLPLRHGPELTAFLGRLYDPASPDYHHYLTAEQFTERFGPTPADYQAVTGFAAQNHLTVRATHGNRLVLDVNGSVADIERAFHLTLRTYRHPVEARDFYAPDTEPSVDASLPVADISGLNNYWRPHPNLRIGPGSAGNATSKTGSGPEGGFWGNDFRAAYLPGVTLTGQGQSLGLVEFSGYYTNDITSYETNTGLPSVPLTNVVVDSYTSGAPTDLGDPEVSLDIELAIAMAPALDAIYVFDAGPTGFPNDVLEAMVESPQINQFSCSWGWNGGPTNTTDSLFQQMNSQGQSFFTAAGDHDAFTVGSNSTNGVDNPDLDNAPASNPYITVVGGTTLTTTGPGGAWSAETVWNWGLQETQYWGSCGGVSSYYPIPAWQTNVSMSANGGSASFRNIPDVAAVADNIFVTAGNGKSSGLYGGTSCATPLWAAVAALLNQQAQALGKPPVGFVNPAIYALAQGASYASSFHDITNGNNFWPGSSSQYSAVRGYDLCTGWGTPAGHTLIDAIAGYGTLTVFPTNGFFATGYVSGPFHPNFPALSLENFGGLAVSWGVTGVPAWLTISPTSGELPEWTGSDVPVSPNINADNLPLGTYSATFSITNSAGPTITNLSYSLQVLQPFSIQPTTGLSATGYPGGPFALGSAVLTLTNAGNRSLNWSAGGLPAWLTAMPANGTVTGRSAVPVTFSPNATAAALPLGTYSASPVITDLTGATSQNVSFVLQVAEPLVIAPAAGLTAAGEVGGPFIFSPTCFALTNLGADPVPWTVTNQPAWLTVTPTSGTLAQNGSAVVTVSLNPATGLLPGAAYTNLVSFSDGLEQTTQTVPVVLQVGQSIVQNGGFEAGLFAGWTLVGDTIGPYTTYNAVEPAAWQSLVVHSGNYGAFLGDVTPATLSQNLPTVPGRNYRLSFWLDNPSAGAGQQFLVNWITNAATPGQIYGVTNPPAFAWTNLTFILPATGTNTELQFGAENVPNFFGLDDVSVAPIPNPAITGFTHSGRSLGFTLSTLPGIDYQLLYATNLAQANWVPLATNPAAAATLTITITNNPGADQQRFYRIRQLP